MSEPEPANAAIQFHDTCASTWDAKYASGGFRKRAAFFERQVLPSLDRPGRWLDVGCGSGFFGRMLAAARGVRVTGVDASAPMIDAATAEAAAAGLGASLDFQRIESAERLPFAAGEFAGALCLSVLEYLGDPLAGLDELARVVAPGGVLVVSVPHARSVVRAGQSVAAALGVRSWPYRTLSRFTLTEPALRRALRARGFESVQILRFDSVLPPALLGLLAPSLIYAVARKSEARRT